MNNSLRARQKAKRRSRILEAARKKFQAHGFASVTVEDIAQEADVSGVTVYNYFGSKAGILLALVSESDDLLIEKLNALTTRCDCEDGTGLIEAVLEFGCILRHHTMSYLSKPTWREVLGASIHEGSRDFGRTYAALDDVLISLMGKLVQVLQERGRVPHTVEVPALADCLFSLQNIRFFQFIADDDLTDAQTNARLSADLAALRSVFGSV